MSDAEIREASAVHQAALAAKKINFGEEAQ